MRLAVFDTNIIVSAGITPGGVPAHLIHDWVFPNKVQLVVCPTILSEYNDVVRRPKFEPYGFPPLWLEFLVEGSLHLPTPQKWSFELPDSRDIPFISLAHAAGAWLVTGNMRHFPEQARNGTIVVSPKDYLAHLAAASE